jgi:hypothetical protein
VASILSTFNSINKNEITADYYYTDLHYIKEILVQLLCMLQELYFSSSLYKATLHDKERNMFYLTFFANQIAAFDILLRTTAGTYYGLDDRAIGVRSPAGAKDFSSILCVLSNGYRE